MDLIDASATKNPKLMLRRTESVVEKMLTNWMSICMYSCLRVRRRPGRRPDLTRRQPRPAPAGRVLTPSAPTRDGLGEQGPACRALLQLGAAWLPARAQSMPRGLCSRLFS